MTSGEDRTGFESLKELIAGNNELMVPEHSRPSRLYTYFSDSTIAVVLMKRFDEGLRPTFWVSRRLEPRKVNYSTTEKEFLAVV